MKSGGTPARRSIARGTSALFFAKSAESLENKWDKVLASAKMRKRVLKNMKRKGLNGRRSECRDLSKAKKGYEQETGLFRSKSEPSRQNRRWAVEAQCMQSRGG